MKNKHTPYLIPKRTFDGYDKQNDIKVALGSERTARKQEAADIRSVNWVPGVSGWRLTPTGLELGNVASGLFPPASITFADIQNIATDKVLGRDTAGSGTIEELGLGAGLSISGGNLVNTVSAYTTEEAQDAVGAMVDASLTYVDGTPSLGVTSTFRRKSLFDHYTNVGNIGTGEDDLYSVTIAAGQLANNGEKLSIEYGGTFVTSGGTATRQLRMYFGGTSIFDTGALIIAGASAWTVYATVIRVSATTVRAMVSLTTQGASLAAYTSYTEVTGLTLANTQVLKITGEAAGVGAATDDIIGRLGSVEWLASA